MSFFKLKALVVAALLLSAGVASADYSYLVTVDTHTLSGLTGMIDLQYNPFGSSTPLSTATISNLSGGLLTADPTNQVTGTVDLSGLPSTLTLTNTKGVNDFYNAFIYGNTLSFNLNLAGPAGVNGFNLALFSDTVPTQVAFSTDKTGNGNVLTINTMADGSAAQVLNYTLNSEAQAAPTPIPAAAWLLGSGLMGLVGVRRRKA